MERFDTSGPHKGRQRIRGQPHSRKYGNFNTIMHTSTKNTLFNSPIVNNNNNVNNNNVNNNNNANNVNNNSQIDVVVPIKCESCKNINIRAATASLGVCVCGSRNAPFDPTAEFRANVLQFWSVLHSASFRKSVVVDFPSQPHAVSVSRNWRINLKLPISDLPDFGGKGLLCTYGEIVKSKLEGHLNTMTSTEYKRILHKYGFVLPFRHTIIIGIDADEIPIRTRKFLLSENFYECGLAYFEAQMHNLVFISSDLNGSHGEYTNTDDVNKKEKGQHKQEAKKLQKQINPKTFENRVSSPMMSIKADRLSDVHEITQYWIMLEMAHYQIAYQLGVLYFKFESERHRVYFSSLFRTEMEDWSIRVLKNDPGLKWENPVTFKPPPNRKVPQPKSIVINPTVVKALEAPKPSIAPAAQFVSSNIILDDAPAALEPAEKSSKLVLAPIPAKEISAEEDAKKEESEDSVSSGLDQEVGDRVEIDDIEVPEEIRTMDFFDYDLIVNEALVLCEYNEIFVNYKDFVGQIPTHYLVPARSATTVTDPLLDIWTVELDDIFVEKEDEERARRLKSGDLRLKKKCLIASGTRPGQMLPDWDANLSLKITILQAECIDLCFEKDADRSFTENTYEIKSSYFHRESMFDGRKNSPKEVLATFQTAKLHPPPAPGSKKVPRRDFYSPLIGLVVEPQVYTADLLEEVDFTFTDTKAGGKFSFSIAFDSLYAGINTFWVNVRGGRIQVKSEVLGFGLKKTSFDKFNHVIQSGPYKGWTVSEKKLDKLVACDRRCEKKIDDITTCIKHNVKRRNLHIIGNGASAEEVLEIHQNWKAKVRKEQKRDYKFVDIVYKSPPPTHWAGDWAQVPYGQLPCSGALKEREHRQRSILEYFNDLFYTVKNRTVDEDGTLKRFVFDRKDGFGLDLAYFRENSVEFLEPLCLEHGDERFHANSHGDKYDEAFYKKAKIITHQAGRFGLMYKTEQVVTFSEELFRQLISPGNFCPTDTPTITYARMERSAKTTGRVNISKNFVQKDELVHVNTLLLANYYSQYFHLSRQALLGALSLN